MLFLATIKSFTFEGKIELRFSVIILPVRLKSRSALAELPGMHDVRTNSLNKFGYTIRLLNHQLFKLKTLFVTRSYTYCSSSENGFSVASPSSIFMKD